MDQNDPIISALIALCKNEGGERNVADAAKISAENLLQITKGVKLPGGNPRGVGPTLRKKITAAFPDWLSVPVAASQEIAQKQCVQQVQNTTESAQLSAECQVMCRMFLTLHEDQRDRVMAGIINLIQQARDPTEKQNLPKPPGDVRAAA